MAGAPSLKAYTRDGEYVAAFKHESDAAAFVAILGEGATIRYSHARRHTIWTEGAEEQSAGESYDFAAAKMIERRAGR